MADSEKRRRTPGKPDPLSDIAETKRILAEKRAQAQAAQPKFKAEHTVAKGETLSEIALKYLGSAAKEKWMAIYNANKDVIGDNPNLIRPGQVLKIPDL